MFKNYIRNIVKEEINDIKLENTLKQLRSKSYWENLFKSQVKHTELLVKGRDEKISKLKKENEELKKSLEKQTKYRTNDYNAFLKIGSESEDLKRENEQLKEIIENLEGELILKSNLLSEQKEENKHLKITLKLSKNKILELKDLYEQEKDKNYKTLESEELKQEIEKLKQENEKLKKELRDSKNGLNGANHVIKNNKEWINSQDKKIKELEGKIRCLKSDKEDLQYNLRRKSTQKIQLETKNKFLEEKLTKISSVINPVRNDSRFGLMCIIDTIRSILKES